MPKNNTRKGKPKKNDLEIGMGKTLERARRKKKKNLFESKNKHGEGGMEASGVESIGLKEDSKTIKSVLEVDNLSDFLGQAEMAGKEFSSEKERFLVLESNASEYREIDNKKTIKWMDTEEKSLSELPELSFPRRPEWNSKTSADELEKLERESFLEWRSRLAHEEERLHSLNGLENNFESGGVVVTPYEKNLEVWRQLWRVLERSTVITQIVDARNPLFYFSEDLEKYLKNEKKPMILLLNKSDFLSLEQRSTWSRYFNEKNINHVFFSASKEQSILDCSEDCSVQPENSTCTEISTPTLLNRRQLLSSLTLLAEKSNNQSDIILGMVGFPNVGKSSVINVLLGVNQHSFDCKRVGVAAQPGKTKHFQTLKVPSEDNLKGITLCDCPGLVFPSFVSTKASLIANGVFPIAHVRGRVDFTNVVEFICRHIPSFILQSVYNFHLKNNTADDLLLNYCTARSYYASSSGVPDTQRAARIIIRDYTKGKLLYCHPPPSTSNHEEYKIETLKTLLNTNENVKERFSKTFSSDTSSLEQMISHQQSLTNPQKSKLDSVVLDDLDIDLELLHLADEQQPPKKKERVKPKKKWAKKNRKLRDPNPYGSLNNSGVIVKAGKYSKTNYTRPNYAGAKAANY